MAFAEATFNAGIGILPSQMEIAQSTQRHAGVSLKVSHVGAGVAGLLIGMVLVLSGAYRLGRARFVSSQRIYAPKHFLAVSTILLGGVVIVLAMLALAKAF